MIIATALFFFAGVIAAVTFRAGGAKSEDEDSEVKNQEAEALIS